MSDIEVRATEALEASLTGSGDLNVDQGAIDRLDVSATGSGDSKLEGLESRSAHVSLTGSGDAEVRATTFDPVEASLGVEQAQAEAARCFKCGTCVECDVCYHLCPDLAISRRPGGGYVIDLAHCKGCGVCAQECPRSAMHLKKSL